MQHSPTLQTRSKIIDAARAYLGTPFHHCGRNVHGLDCAGLLVCVASDMGFACRDVRAYSRHPSGKIEQFLDKQMTVTDEYASGNWLLFWLSSSKVPQHLAMITDWPMIIHAHDGAGQVLETRCPGQWMNQVVKCYQFKELG